VGTDQISDGVWAEKLLKIYRKSPDSSRVPDERRVPDTGRGSRQIVLIEAGGFYPEIYGRLINSAAENGCNKTKYRNL